MKDFIYRHSVLWIFLIFIPIVPIALLSPAFLVLSILGLALFAIGAVEDGKRGPGPGEPGFH